MGEEVDKIGQLGTGRNRERGENQEEWFNFDHLSYGIKIRTGLRNCTKIMNRRRVKEVHI